MVTLLFSLEKNSQNEKKMEKKNVCVLVIVSWSVVVSYPLSEVIVQSVY